MPVKWTVVHIQVVCYLYYCVCVKSELLLLLSDNILEGGGGGERGVLRLLYTVALRRPKCHSANISRQDKAETSAHIRADPNTNHSNCRMGEGFEGERTPLSFCISQEKKGIERKGRKWIYFSFFLGYSKEWQPDETKQRETSCCIKRTQTKAMVGRCQTRHLLGSTSDALWTGRWTKKTNDNW